MKRAQRIAHRGAMAEHPAENTLAAFSAALEKGYDGIELDVRHTKDGRIIVFHDESLERLTGLAQDVADTELQQIQTLDVQGEPIPVLEEVLTSLPKTTILVDIKTVEAVSQSVKLCKKSAHTVVFGSSNFEVLEALAKEDVDSRILYTSRRPFLANSQIKRYKLTEIGQHYWILNWIGVFISRKQGLKIRSYPIKSRLTARIIEGHGVDGLTCDRWID